MKYIITEQQKNNLTTKLKVEGYYEDLIDNSKKRHVSKEPDLKNGYVEVGSDILKYEIQKSKNKYVYVRIKFNDKNVMVYIMTDEDFIQMDRNEQEKVIEHRIKKFLEKKKSINESIGLNWIKRRVNQEFMEHYIWKSEENYPMICDDFGDEFDYADNVIEGAVNDFLTIQEETFLDDRYDEIHDILIEKCKDWFGEYLFEIYRTTCSENEL